MRAFAMCLLSAMSVSGCAKGSATRDNSTARLKELCGTTTNMSPAVCDCVAGKADKELSADARAFLVASMDKQEDRVAELRGKLTMEELTKTGMFFVTAPASCAAAERGK